MEANQGKLQAISFFWLKTGGGGVHTLTGALGVMTRLMLFRRCFVLFRLVCSPLFCFIGLSFSLYSSVQHLAVEF